jgi:N-6 DNA Methylase/Eco57I restriction-modification methylase
MTLGITGHLLSTSFLAAKLQAAATPHGAPLHRSAALGPASSLRALLDAGAAPLLEMAGLATPSDVEISDRLLAATVAAGDRALTLLVAPWGAPLHLHWRAGIEHATRRASRWCLLFNGVALRLVDAGRPHSARFTEFDLALMSADRESAAAFRFVLARLPGAFETLVHESDQHGVAVCRSLRDGVLSASSDVLAALARRGGDRAALDAALEQALTIVYRVLFLLFAESRGLVPLWHPLYHSSYSIDALVTASARSRDARGLWDALRAMARLAHSGCRAGDLRVTPFNGRLFSPARTPLAERHGLDDERARRALVSLATRGAAGGAGRERIAYRDLGVEQLGSVYESLLDYQPSADPVGLVSGSGVRKSTGTFYTPQPIADYLVRSTLGPLVHEAEPAAILRLRIVDPSMGSGAFLVAACHYLAQAYEAALVRSGAHPGDFSDGDRAAIRRTVAERCLYGVDINPMAVQLARLSLWLTTLAADRPLTFLDHRLQTGDSLLGAWLDNIRRTPSRVKRPARRDTSTGDLFDETIVERALKAVLPIRFSLELTPDDTLEQVRAKERALSALADRGSVLSRWKRVADIWCASWLSDDRHGVPPAAVGALTDHVLDDRGSLPPHVTARYLQCVAAISSSRRLFHWELEFPEVFFDADGRRLPRPGFDAVIGNPPWEVVRGDAPALRFERQSGVYSSSVNGHGNLYQLFAERAMSLARPGGRLGLVLPSGLATDHGATQLRQRLLQDCDVDALVGLDNRRNVFAIHRSVKFLLTTATRGAPTSSIGCRLGESDITALDASAGHPQSSPWFRVRLTPAFLHRVSGDALTIPEFRTATDVAIVERAVTLFPPLGSDGGWAARFGRELNATDDRACFGARGLPVVDGRHIEPFRARVLAAGRFISAATARRRLPAAPFEHARLAYRDVAGATNKLTLIAAILPSGCVSTHTLFCLRTRLPPPLQRFLCGMFNSLVVNYLVRMRVTTHVTTATVERLPLPPPGFSPSAEREIAALARLLSRKHDLAAWAQLQARVAHLYQLTPAEFAHVLGTFPLIAIGDRNAALQLYEATEAQGTQR